MELSTVRRAGIRLATVFMVALSVAACTNTPKPEGDLAGNGKNSPATPGSARDFATNVGDIVYFSTDQTDLSPEAQQTLANQARWLQQYAQYTITIEGHADERGTREYNLALGERRATAAKNFLVSSGIPATRISTTSFGKERPAVLGNDESAWGQNRRAVTVIAN